MGEGGPYTVFSWSDVEEVPNPGEAEICLLLRGDTLEGGIKGVEDVYIEGTDSSRKRIFLILGRYLVYQATFNLPHPVVMWVVGPHG